MAAAPIFASLVYLFTLTSQWTGGDTKASNVTLLGIQSQRLQSSGTINLNDRAMQHPLCTQNTSAYVGQTAKMYCCLARLDRDLSVSWIRKGDVVVLTHGTTVFTSDERVMAVEENGIWSLVIRRVGHSDAGNYECQTNSEIKGSVTVNLDIKETKARIRGPTEYIHSGSTLKLSCQVYLGHKGPDEAYAQNAVIHWFHEQRLLDPELERWRSKSAKHD